MDEKPDPALRGLFLVILIGFFLVIFLPFVVLKGLSGTVAFFAALIAVTLPLIAVTWGVHLLNRRISRRSALILWPLLGATTILLPRALIGPPSGGPWLILLIPLVAAIVGFVQTVFPDA